MLSTTNILMVLAGLLVLVVGVVVRRGELADARGLGKLVFLGVVFYAASLAAFAPEHFKGGPQFVQDMVPPWMPARSFWPKLVGVSLFAGALSLALRRFVSLSAPLLGTMFLIFVSTIYFPSVLRHPDVRIAWFFFLRDLSFSAAAWAIAGRYYRESAPGASKAMILFSRAVIAAAGIYYGLSHLLHPSYAPGVPSSMLTPDWVPLPTLWAGVAGAVLIVGGILLALNRRARTGATAIGILMLVLALAMYVPVLLMGKGAEGLNEGINLVADTLLYSGAALSLAAALPDA